MFAPLYFGFVVLTTQTTASLSQVHRPCAQQEARHIEAFLQDLEQKGYAPPDAKILQGVPGLTKAERLQLVNHAPMSVVELHTVRLLCSLSLWKSLDSV